MTSEPILMAEIAPHLFHSHLRHLPIVGFLPLEIMIKRDTFSLSKLLLDDLRIPF